MTFKMPVPAILETTKRDGLRSPCVRGINWTEAAAEILLPSAFYLDYRSILVTVGRSKDEVTEEFIHKFKSGDLVDVKVEDGQWSGPHKPVRVKQVDSR